MADAGFLRYARVEPCLPNFLIKTRRRDVGTSSRFDGFPWFVVRTRDRAAFNFMKSFRRTRRRDVPF